MYKEQDLKAVIKLLRDMASKGTMEQGQEETISKAINKLRRAFRSHDRVKMQAAVLHVARIFLRTQGR